MSRPADPNPYLLLAVAIHAELFGASAQSDAGTSGRPHPGPGLLLGSAAPFYHPGLGLEELPVEVVHGSVSAVEIVWIAIVVAGVRVPNVVPDMSAHRPRDGNSTRRRIQ